MLITGGAGFIGSNLCEHFLSNGVKVICLDNFSTGKRKNIENLIHHPYFTLIEGDIRDLDTCKKAAQKTDIILHQAALGSVPRSIENPITTNEVNITGFLNMLWAAKECKSERFIFAASSSTYGNHPALPKIEDKIGEPLSPYAVTKLVNEKYAAVFSKLYGIKTIGLRYFNVFGKNQDPDGQYAAAIPKFIKSFINNQPITIFGNGEQTRDFTYIKNVIQANELASVTENQDAFNQIYNVAYGENTTLNEVINTLRNLLSTYSKSVNEVKVIYEQERVGDIKHSLASIEKAKTLLNYSPKYNLNNGLVEAIDWYWKNLNS